MIVKLYSELSAFERYKLHEYNDNRKVHDVSLFKINDKIYKYIHKDYYLLEVLRKIDEFTVSNWLKNNVEVVTFWWDIKNQLEMKNRIHKLLNLKCYW